MYRVLCTLLLLLAPAAYGQEIITADIKWQNHYTEDEFWEKQEIVAKYFIGNWKTVRWKDYIEAIHPVLMHTVIKVVIEENEDAKVYLEGLSDEDKEALKTSLNKLQTPNLENKTKNIIHFWEEMDDAVGETIGIIRFGASWI